MMQIETPLVADILADVVAKLDDIERRQAATEDVLRSILENVQKAAAIAEALQDGGLPGVLKLMRGGS